MMMCGDGTNMTTMTNDGDEDEDAAIATDGEDGGSDNCVRVLSRFLARRMLEADDLEKGKCTLVQDENEIIAYFRLKMNDQLQR